MADRLLGVGGREAEPPETALKGLEQAPLPRAFAVQLVQRLRDQDPKVTPALLWLDRRLLAQGTTADEIVRAEHQAQGAMNVTVRNVITSMRFMSAVDWAEFFESVSQVDAVLRANSNFAAMDFPTRDRYRHAIEELARGSGHTEIEVARLAIAAAERAAPEGPSRDGATVRREQDPGYYLISRGRHAVETELGFRAPFRDRIVRANAAAGILGYLGTIALVSAIILALPLFVLGGVRRQRMDSLHPGDSRRHPGNGRGRVVGEPRRHDLYRPGNPAWSGASRGSTGRVAHDGRGAHSSDDASGNRGANRTSGGSLSGESGRRLSFRSALGLDRFRDRKCAR